MESVSVGEKTERLPGGHAYKLRPNTHAIRLEKESNEGGKKEMGKMGGKSETSETAASNEQTFQDANVKVFTRQILPGNEIERNPRREGVCNTRSDCRVRD